MERVIGIPLNLPNDGSHTGVERYVIELVRELLKKPLPAGVRVELYSAKPITLFGELPKGWSNIVLSWNFKGWTHLRLSWYLLRHAPDVLFVPMHEIPFISGKAKVVATIHDIAFAVVPHVYRKSEVRRQWSALRRAVRKSDYLLAVSEGTKQDLIRHLGVPNDHVFVSPLAHASTLQPSGDEVRVRETLRSHRLPYKQYLLFVGRLEYKKGVHQLLTYFDSYKKAQGIGDPLQLVLVGKFGYGESEIRAILDSLGRSDIHVLGFIEDESLSDIFEGARAFIFPTQYEGFGMPLLEAMSFDLPIVTSDLPITHEVAGDAAVYASVGDTGAWVSAIRTLMHREDIEAQLIAAGSSQRARFFWEQTATTTWEVLMQALSL